MKKSSESYAKEYSTVAFEEFIIMTTMFHIFC